MIEQIESEEEIGPRILYKATMIIESPDEPHTIPFGIVENKVFIPSNDGRSHDICPTFYHEAEKNCNT